MTPELQDQIRVWRQKAVEGTMTEDDMIQVVQNLRAGRLSAQQAATASKTKAKKAGPVISADDLLDEMMTGE